MGPFCPKFCPVHDLSTILSFVWVADIFVVPWGFGSSLLIGHPSFSLAPLVFLFVQYIRQQRPCRFQGHQTPWAKVRERTFYSLIASYQPTNQASNQLECQNNVTQRENTIGKKETVLLVNDFLFLLCISLKPQKLRHDIGDRSVVTNSLKEGPHEDETHSTEID